MRFEDRQGASKRLKDALDAVGYPSTREGRNAAFASEFELSSATVQRILTQNYVPTKQEVREAIADRAKLSVAYWMFGIDSYCENIIVGLYGQAVEAVMNQLKKNGKSLDEVPTGLIVQLSDAVYRHGADNHEAIEPDHVQRMLDLAFSLSAGEPGAQDA